MCGAAVVLPKMRIPQSVRRPTPWCLRERLPPDFGERSRSSREHRGLHPSDVCATARSRQAGPSHPARGLDRLRRARCGTPAPPTERRAHRAKAKPRVRGHRGRRPSQQTTGGSPSGHEDGEQERHTGRIRPTTKAAAANTIVPMVNIRHVDAAAVPSAWAPNLDLRPSCIPTTQMAAPTAMSTSATTPLSPVSGQRRRRVTATVTATESPERFHASSVRSRARPGSPASS
jgi:hypothetical protein